MLHVSDLLHYEKCPRFLWNTKKHPLPFEGFYHMIVPYPQLWKKYLGIEACPSGQVGDTNEKSLALLKDHDAAVNIRFEYKECRTKIPVLIKLKQGYKAIYPHLSAYPKETEGLVIKINKEIAEHAGISIIKNEVIYLNKDYKRSGELDLYALLKTSDHLFNRRNNMHLSIEECMNKYTFDLDDWISKTKSVMNQMDEPETIRSKKCTSVHRCIYYPYCFDESDEPDDSILFLTTSHNKLKAYENGIRHISEMDYHDLEGFRLQYAQYMASKNGYFCDYLAIRNWVSKVKYPISYLDFEWDTFAIPPYNNMKPFDVLCFQYSLHIEEENQPLKHKDFFGYGDCREKFIQSILENVPKAGSVLVYNMEGAEKLRLHQLAEQFPQYSESLKQICDRMIDLSKPFEAGLIYDNHMRGHYSLKNVLPCFTNTYSYKQLSIKDGLHAVKAYRIFEKANKEEQRQLRESIRTYCQMDTFAEYIVYHGILNLLKEKENA